MRSMEFQPLPQTEDPVPLSFFERASFDMLALAQLVVLALVCLILGLFVIRPVLTSPPRPQLAQIAPPPSAAEAGEPPEITSLPSVGNEISNIGPLDDFQPLDLPAFGDMESQPNPADRLRQLIDEKQDETVEVLSQWMNDPQGEEVAR